MSIDLNNLSLKELKDLQSRVAKAVSSFDARRKKADMAALEEKARELGYASLAELTGEKSARKRATAAAKYANPADQSDTWSGRGRQPRWFAAAMAAGKNPADMAI
jgi:DNA-binding protein H-NS